MVKTTMYTPILRWKEAEKNAIKNLPDGVKDKILPLFSLVYPQKYLNTSSNTEKTNILNHAFMKFPEEILANWGDGRSFIIDFDSLGLGQEEKTKRIIEFIKNSRRLNLEPIISVSPYDFPSIKKTGGEALSETKFCVRFKASDIEKIKILTRPLKECKRKITLLLDLMENTSESLFNRAADELIDVDDIDDFDNVIIAAGAFPVDMSHISAEKDRLWRTEWLNWKKRFLGGIKCPAYADYTIRHPIYNPKIEFYRATATIKYTLENEWRFFKGKGPKYEQCLAAASVFIEDKEYYGKKFSAGDAYIFEKGKLFPAYIKATDERKTKIKTGNAKQWIFAGINHHIEVVVDQLSRIDGKKAVS